MSTSNPSSWMKWPCSQSVSLECRHTGTTFCVQRPASTCRSLLKYSSRARCGGCMWRWLVGLERRMRMRVRMNNCLGSMDNGESEHRRKKGREMSTAQSNLSASCNFSKSTLPRQYCSWGKEQGPGRTCDHHGCRWQAQLSHQVGVVHHGYCRREWRL